MYKYVIIYILLALLTYLYTSITIRNPNDEDRDYAIPPEWDFSRVGAAIIFPIFWLIYLIEYISKLSSNVSKYLYDRSHR